MHACVLCTLLPYRSMCVFNFGNQRIYMTRVREKETVVYVQLQTVRACFTRAMV
jgi:hypothetical protein